MAELKPCPFCGGIALDVGPLYDAEKGYVVKCIRCRCKTWYFATEAEAIEAWNRRASDA